MDEEGGPDPAMVPGRASYIVNHAVANSAHFVNDLVAGGRMGRPTSSQSVRTPLPNDDLTKDWVETRGSTESVEAMSA